MAETKEKKAKVSPIYIKPPNMEHIDIPIRGTTPYVQNKFSSRILADIKTKQELGSAAPSGKSGRKPKDFQQEYKERIHRSTEGWEGIPASAFRNAMISACRVSGIAMTKAKLCVFADAHGFDETDGTPLVKITKGKPEYMESTVRLENGVLDIRPRPAWKPGWEAIVPVTYDADQITKESIVNLMARAGLQVGIGEGRHDSKKSAGTGFGTFTIISLTPENTKNESKAKATKKKK